MGGGDIETAKSVAERANKTMHTIYEMPIGYEWVFRRGDKPVYTKIIDLDELMKSEKIVLKYGKKAKPDPDFPYQKYDLASYFDDDDDESEITHNDEVIDMTQDTQEEQHEELTDEELMQKLEEMVSKEED